MTDWYFIFIPPRVRCINRQINNVLTSGQGEQMVAVVFDTVPAGHILHDEAPFREWYPAGHSSHTEDMELA